MTAAAGAGIAHMLVVVPARDEQATLPATLDSLALARAALDPRVGSRIVVVADACRDRTAAAARARVGPGDLVLRSDRACVGAARRQASSAVVTARINSSSAASAA